MAQLAYSVLFSIAEADSRPKSAHRYNVAQQQQIYRSEIERIWKAQHDSLSNKVEPELTEEEATERPKAGPSRATSVRFEGRETSPLFAGSPPKESGFSRASTVERGEEPPANRVLRIKRLVSPNQFLSPSLPEIDLVLDFSLLGRWRMENRNHPRCRRDKRIYLSQANLGS